MTNFVPIKPYVDFVELKRQPKVELALRLMSKRMFSGKFDHWSQFTWEQQEGMVIERLKLRGKQLALFLGHSKRWANSPI
jgi:hypothetical protein